MLASFPGRVIREGVASTFALPLVMSAFSVALNLNCALVRRHRRRCPLPAVFAALFPGEEVLSCSSLLLLLYWGNVSQFHCIPRFFSSDWLIDRTLASSVTCCVVLSRVCNASLIFRASAGLPLNSRLLLPASADSFPVFRMTDSDFCKSSALA